MIARSILGWLRSNMVLVIAGTVAVTGIGVGGVLSIAQATALSQVTVGSKPVYPADRVPSDAPSSGDEMPFEVAPDASGESAWGAARVNPTGGIGSFDLWFDGNALQIRFSGNCGPNAYLSSLGNATVTVSGSTSGFLSNSSLCMPNSRTSTMSMPVSLNTCWRDSSLTATVSGTPFHDGSYSVAIPGYQRPCPGEWQNWDWSTNSYTEPGSELVAPAPPAQPSPEPTPSDTATPTPAQTP